MKHTLDVRGLKTLACLGLTSIAAWCAAGCSLSGSWQTVSVEPKGAPFPLEVLTFDNKTNDTATWLSDCKRSTTTGQFKWNGRSLELGRQGFNSHTYRAQKQLDGSLIMYFQHDDATMTAVLKKKPTPK